LYECAVMKNLRRLINGDALLYEYAKLTKPKTT
jgi:hypothetical protein